MALFWRIYFHAVPFVVLMLGLYKSFQQGALSPTLVIALSIAILFRQQWQIEEMLEAAQKDKP